MAVASKKIIFDGGKSFSNKKILPKPIQKNRKVGKFSLKQDFTV